MFQKHSLTKNQFILICVLWISFAASNCYANTVCNKDPTLYFVQVFFRHGDRTPSHSFKTDPYKNDWPEGPGELTNLGKESSYELGQFIQDRYKEYLSASYYYSHVYTHSSAVDRTIATAQSLLAALYPPNNSQMFNPTINWQPIPVYTIPSDQDYVLDDYASCPNYDKLLKEQMESAEMEEINEKNEDLYKLLTNVTGNDVQNLFDVSDISDTLNVEKIHNFTLPDWATQSVLSRMNELRNLKYVWRSKTKSMCRLLGGASLGLIKNYMLQKINGKGQELEIVLHSSHESMVSALLSALSVFNGIDPPYNAAVIFELYRNPNDNYTIQILYRNSSTEEPQVLSLPECSNPCSYDLFDDITKDVVPDDIQKECGAQ